jgi:regulator of replication initiation timing
MDSARLKLDDLTRENQELQKESAELRDQLAKAKAQLVKNDQQVKKLELRLDTMQQDVKRLKRIEFLFDEEQHQRIELE